MGNEGVIVAMLSGELKDVYGILQKQSRLVERDACALAPAVLNQLYEILRAEESPFADVSRRLADIMVLTPRAGEVARPGSYSGGFATRIEVEQRLLLNWVGAYGSNLAVHQRV